MLKTFFLTLILLILLSCSSSNVKEISIISTNSISKDLSKPQNYNIKENSNTFSLLPVSQKDQSFDEKKYRYKNFDIENSAEGLSVNKAGKRLIFIKNVNGSKTLGRFELKPLLKGTKQLVYLSFTGGNHCCVNFWIVDLDSSKPRIIFKSTDYDVQGNFETDDFLPTYDEDSDGNLEIMQKQSIYIPSVLDNCAWVLMPKIVVGFKYDRKAQKYLPARKITPYQKKWNEEVSKDILKANSEIKSGKFPGIYYCEYRSIITTTALSYILTDKSNHGFEYLRKNLLAFDLQNDDFVNLNSQKTEEDFIELRNEIKKELVNNKLFKAITSK